MKRPIIKSASTGDLTDRYRELLKRQQVKPDTFSRRDKLSKDMVWAELLDRIGPTLDGRPTAEILYENFFEANEDSEETFEDLVAKHANLTQ